MKKNLGKTTPQGRAKKRVRKVATTTKKTITKKVKADIDKLVKKASATIDKSVAKVKKAKIKKCAVKVKKTKKATATQLKNLAKARATKKAKSTKTSLAGARLIYRFERKNKKTGKLEYSYSHTKIKKGWKLINTYKNIDDVPLPF